MKKKKPNLEIEDHNRLLCIVSFTSLIVWLADITFFSYFLYNLFTVFESKIFQKQQVTS